MPKEARFRCKIEDWRGIHDGYWLTLRPGYTALVGPNGAGKTTLLRQLKEIAEKRGYLVVHYSNLTDGGHAARQGYLENGSISLLATAALSSEGENITINFGPTVRRIGQYITRSVREEKDLMILLDSLDSGASIDRMRELMNLFDMILRDHGVADHSRPDLGLYIVNAVNAYELARGRLCVDPRTGKSVVFGSYEDYAGFICSYDKSVKNPP